MPSRVLYVSLFQELVLHNIMPIFTFMGVSILRQDSLYSFQIITKTIDTIIPPLIKVGMDTGQRSYTGHQASLRMSSHSSYALTRASTNCTDV
jgi:hypothetical protein